MGEDNEKAYLQDGQTPRYHGALGGKNAYALAFGSSDLSKILLHNKGQKHPPLSPNHNFAGVQGDKNSSFMDSLMRKSLNPEDNGVFAKFKNESKGGATDILVPRDFMIKTAYVRKRRNTTAQGKGDDA